MRLGKEQFDKINSVIEGISPPCFISLITPSLLHQLPKTHTHTHTHTHTDLSFVTQEKIAKRNLLEQYKNIQFSPN